MTINIYGRHYKKYIPVVVAIFLVCLFIVFVFPGVKEGIELKGGTLIIVRSEKAMDAPHLEQVLREKFPITEVRVTSISSPAGTGSGAIIEFAGNTELVSADALLSQAKAQAQSNPAAAKENALAALNAVSAYIAVPDTSAMGLEELLELAGANLTKANEMFQLRLQEFIKGEFLLGEDAKFQRREIGPALGEAFYESALTVSIIAIALVVLVVFAFFREVIPSVAVISAAFFDIAFALAAMSLLGISLSLSSIPALLMLIGYSVDTDILLTTRVLKRKESTPALRALDSMKTGLTMTFTTIAALLAMLVLSFFGQILVIFEISAVLLAGLCGDIIATWFLNAPVLLWYVEKKTGGAG